MSFTTYVTGTQKLYEKSDTDIKIGSKVQFKTEDGFILNLIAIEHHPSDIYDTWLCVDPCCYSKHGACTLYNCFTDDLTLGWNSRIRNENHVLDELISTIKKDYLNKIDTQFDNAIYEIEKIIERLKNK